MKTKLSIITLVLLSLGLFSCSKDEATSTKVDRSETLTLGAGYTNDIYYSFKNGVIAEVSRASWDIAFSVSTRSSSILINEGAGVKLKVYPNAWSWSGSIDTTGYHSWEFLNNADTTWEEGAFNANATGHPNYGWGIYNSNNHNIENADGGALYIIKLRNGNFKKIWIETKFSALQKYSFRYADLDGSNEQDVADMDISDSKANYVYYSLQDNLRLDREPDATTWDLVFTKWVDNSINYTVTGVLQNIDIPAIDLTVDDPANFTYTDDQFVDDINTIGSDWKTFNGTQYDIATNRVFVVKDKSAKVYRIVFTGFAGSSTGVLSFDIKQL
jgi:hypothetical protein